MFCVFGVENQHLSLKVLNTFIDKQHITVCIVVSIGCRGAGCVYAETLSIHKKFSLLTISQTCHICTQLIVLSSMQNDKCRGYTLSTDKYFIFNMSGQLLRKPLVGFKQVIKKLPSFRSCIVYIVAWKNTFGKIILVLRSVNNGGPRLLPDVEYLDYE